MAAGVHGPLVDRNSPSVVSVSSTCVGAEGDLQTEAVGWRPPTATYGVFEDVSSLRHDEHTPLGSQGRDVGK